MLARTGHLTSWLPVVAAALGLAAGCDWLPGGGEDSLRFEPGRLQLQAVDNRTDPAAGFVTLHFDGAGTVAWTAASDQSWATVSPLSGR